jgi:L-amino acid N-acyltransferase YncA
MQHISPIRGWLYGRTGSGLGNRELQVEASCYMDVVEGGIYVSPLILGCGVGRAILDALIESSETHGVWTLQAAIIAENFPSVSLQAKCGFRVVG